MLQRILWLAAGQCEELKTSARLRAALHVPGFKVTRVIEDET